MKKISRRPFLPIFVLLIGGMVLSRFIFNFLVVSLVAGILLILWLYTEYYAKSIAKWLFYILIFCAGCLFNGLSGNGVPITDIQLDLTGVVLSQRNLNNYQRTIVRSPELNSKLALHIPNELQIHPGSWLEFSGDICKPDKARNPGEFSYYNYLSTKGIYGVVTPSQVKILDKKSSYLTWIYRLQNYVVQNLKENVEDYDLVSALVLGRRQNLNEEQQHIWQQLGINHLLAISGMHIGLLAAVLAYVIQLFPGPQVVKKFLISVTLLIYVLLSGSSASAWRAWLAVVIGLIGTEHGVSDGLHTWSLVGTIMLLFSPNFLWQTGFQLSFVASGSILLWSPIFAKISGLFSENLLGKIGSRILVGLAVSFVAQAGLFPLLIYYFQELALMAPIATLIMLPLVFGLLISGLILGLAGSLVFPIGWVVNQLTVIINKLGIWLVRFSPTLIIPQLPFVVVALWYFVFLTIGWIYRHNYLFPRRQSNVRWLIRLLCLLALVSLPFFISRPLEITVLDVGQGDAIYIRTPYRQHILIDGGGDSVYWQQRGKNVGLQTVVPYLKYRGVKELDLVILSHPHEDHLHGLLAVLKGFPVKYVVDNGLSHTTRSYERYLQLLDEKKINYFQARAGDSILLKGNLRLDVLHPAIPLKGTSSDHNNNSLVVSLSYQGKTLLFTGDLDNEGQMDLLNRGIGVADWLKVPHHGSKAALYTAFYETIKPKYAIISVGTNSHGHPHQEVIKYLKSMGIKVLRTDIEGAVTFFVWNGVLGRFLSAR